MIYILKNNKEEYYVGQTINLKVRLAQHKNEHPGFSLLEIRNICEDQDFWEREIIQELVREGKTVINYHTSGWRTASGRNRLITEEERNGRAEYYQMYNELERTLVAEMDNNYW